MIRFLGFLFSFAFPIIIGLLAIAILTGKKLVLPFLERLALSYLIGTLLLSLSLFLLSIVGVKFYFVYIFIFWVVLLLLLFVYLTQKKASLLILESLPFRKMYWIEILLCVLMAAQVFYLYAVLGGATAQGRLILYARQILPGMKSLHLPLTEVWTAVCVQGWNLLALNFIVPTFFVVTGVLVYYALKRYLKRVYALFFTLVFILLPIIPGLGCFSPCSNLVLNAYIIATVIYLLHWTKTKERGFLLISLVLALGAIWTK